MTRNRRVGLIATAASVRSGAYERTLHRLDETIHVVSRACPLLVPLVENGRYQPGDAVIETVAREYLEPLRQEGLDVLILGWHPLSPADGYHRGYHGSRRHPHQCQ